MEASAWIGGVFCAVVLLWLSHKLALRIDHRFKWLEIYIEDLTGRVNRLSEQLSSLSSLPEAIPATAWRIGLSIEPNWYEILNRQLPDLELDGRTPGEIDNAVRGLIRDAGIVVDLESSLYQKNFHFTIFHDELTGMDQIWSYHHKQFVDKIEIVGKLFFPEYLGKLRDAFPESKLEDFLIINGYNSRDIRIGFHTWSPIYNEIGMEIAKIPYRDLMSFLLAVEDRYGSAMYAVRKFPEHITKSLVENSIKYEPERYHHSLLDLPFNREMFDPVKHNPKEEWPHWSEVEIYKQGTMMHVFENRYLTTCIDVQCFRPDEWIWRKKGLSPFLNSEWNAE